MGNELIIPFLSMVAAVAYAIQARFQYLKQKEENEIRDKRKK